jgi:hypothetical protein
MVRVLQGVVIVPCHIDFATYDWLYLGILLGHLQELLDSVHVAMVCHGQGWHSQLLGTFKKASYRSLAVKYGKLCVYVKMDK